MSDFQKMADKAWVVKKKYNKIEPKKWGLEQDFMGLIKDVGDLSKILMVYQGYRDDLDGDARKILEHELVDVLWSIMVIAKKTDINLEKSFWKNMDALENRIDNKK